MKFEIKNVKQRKTTKRRSCNFLVFSNQREHKIFEIKQSKGDKAKQMGKQTRMILSKTESREHIKRDQSKKHT